MPTVQLEKVAKAYKSGRVRRDAVSDIDLTIEQGEFVFVVGSSGAGKSTLLKMISGQIRPDQGTVRLDGTNLYPLPPLGFSRARRNFGYVSQEPQLMRRRKVYENLTMVARIGGFTREKKLQDLACKALSIVGLSNVVGKFPGELSIGEARRVELARAIINSPPILVLDELTANLDEDNIWDILHLLTEMNRQGTTIIMATHARMFVNIMRRRVVTLVDGKIAGDVAGGRYGDISSRKKIEELIKKGKKFE